MQTQEKIRIRRADVADAPFVALRVISALGVENPDDKIVECMTAISAMDEVLYSWRNAWIAECGGVAAGMLLAYDGANYALWRQRTFDVLKDMMGYDLTGMQDETCAGEFYLDSLSVLPAFRRKGVARQLLEKVLEMASAQGHSLITLAVAPDNTLAFALYRSLGFEKKGMLHIFDYDYEKMEKLL